MTSIGEGARREATEQIKLLGTNNIRVKQSQLTGEMREEAQRRFSRGLTYDDALLVGERLPGLVGVAPMKFLDQEVRFGGRQGAAQVVGTTPEYQDVTNFRVGQGRFLSPFDVRDSKRVCVLGSELKQELFGYADPPGAGLTIAQSWCQAAGGMEPRLIR